MQNKNQAPERVRGLLLSALATPHPPFGHLLPSLRGEGLEAAGVSPLSPRERVGVRVLAQDFRTY